MHHALISGSNYIRGESVRVPKRRRITAKTWWQNAKAILSAALIVMGVSAALETACAQDASAVSEPQKLPSLRLARTLPAPNEINTFGMFQSGTFGLTWSRDGERLAAYIRNGLAIMLWSPDGKYQHEIPRYNNAGLDSYVLAFLFGSSQLIASPAADSNSRDDRHKVVDQSISILDPETGKVLRTIAGPKPGKNSSSNIAINIAISPDERLAALVHRSFADLRIEIYTTADWQLAARVDLGDENLSTEARAIAFSPDGKMLALQHGLRGRIKLFEVGSWKLLRSFDAFPEDPPRYTVATSGVLAFSPDGTLLAVASNGGGSWWMYPDGTIAPKGRGEFKTYFPAEPLRIYRVADGERVASLGSFPGGIHSGELAWSPNGNYLGFLDSVGDIRLWDPSRPGNSAAVASMGRHSRTLLFSRDGSQLAANFEAGVKIFDIITAR
jgi:WD40 repeat protein